MAGYLRTVDRVMLSGMRARFVTVGGVLVSVALLGVVVYVLTRPDFVQPGGVTGARPDWWTLVVPLSWTATGAALLWLQPRNAVGALILFVGVCQAISNAATAYGMYGVGVAHPHWPAAQWVAFLGPPLWIPGVFPMITVLIAIYPDGRLPDRRWRLPIASAIVGIALLTLAMTRAYHDIAPGRPPLDIEIPDGLAVVFIVVMAVSLLGSVIALWVMSVMRLVHARSPERQQLAWLLCAAIPFFVLVMSVRSPAFALCSMVVPIAVAVGIVRYHMFGIDFVLGRGLLYGALTAVVVGAFLLVAAVAGSSLDHGALLGVFAAIVVVIGLAPLRERAQRGIDRLVYGDRRDPLRAVTRIGDSVAAAGQPGDLLPAVLMTVTNAVRAPGATVVGPDGRIVAVHGSDAPGIDLPLFVSGELIGTLRVAGRRRNEPYTAGDQRLLGALAPQVAVVVSALDLGEALEAERDRVVAATRTERDRLRRDLHDGLGPSLSGVGLGLQALESALAAGDDATATELLARVRAEARTAVADVRRILDDLRPVALDEAGFADAIRRYTSAFPTSLSIDVDVPESLKGLPPQVETVAYRIAQEGLTNVVRHAGATHARLRVAAVDHSLRVEVADDGQGFGRAQSAGVGLGSMRHRAESVGGTLAVSTGDGGTTVVASLPLGGLA